MNERRALLSRTVVNTPASVILIRLMVGAVFFSEGQKFLTRVKWARSVLRSRDPIPEVSAPFVGIFELLRLFV